MTRVLVVAPSPIVRAGLEALLGTSPALEVVGTATSLTSVQIPDEADVVLVDNDGIDIDPRFNDAGVLRCPLVLLWTSADEQAGLDAVRLGVRAVLPRSADPQEIIAAIQAVAAGLIVAHPQTVDLLVPYRNIDAPSPRASGVEHLTQREIEVLAMLSEGAANKEIARRLGISDHTVKFHVGSILSKLDAASRTEAVTTGIRRGLIML